MVERLVKVFETYNQGDIAFLKSLLDANGIFYRIDNEGFAGLRPLSGVTMVVRIAESDLKKATELLKDFNGGSFGERRI